jgi:S1-C subfamily serine protease
MKRLFTIFTTLITLLLCGGLFASSTHARPSKPALDAAIRSTVLVLTLDDDMNVIATGSGSIVDNRGLVLTNFHVVGEPETGELYSREGLVGIALTRDLRQPAVPMFIAQVIKGTAELDMALVQVVSDVEGKQLKGCLQLPTYKIGASDDLGPGDDITAIGFPGLGGYSYTVTNGSISGFETDESSGEVIWFKTDAEISPGNSGGSAINDAGELIGVPTAGRVNTEAGGKIGLVRPIKLSAVLLNDLEDVDFGTCKGTLPVVPGGDSVGGTTGGTSTNQGSSQGEVEGEAVLTGQVVSADNGRAIRGAYILILKPGVSWEDVDDSNLEENLIDAVESDRKGYFETQVPLDVSQTYGIGVLADGYTPILVDEVAIAEGFTGESVIDLGVVELKAE